MKATAIYARVSTADQADNGTSLESQVAACQKYAEQNGYTVLETFKEQKSGASLDRPQLDRLRELARAKEISAVIFYALDRLSRDETDTLILAREWRNHDVELKCATVAIEDTPQGQFMLTMLAAVGKLERAGILERTMRGKRQSVRNGKVLRTSVPIYGYVHNEGRYEICEPRAEWVRRMFDWYCKDGLPLLAIAFKLLDLGVQSNQGSVWTSSTVRGVITNEAYTGQYWWGKETTAGGKRRPRPRSEWIGPVSIPAIVTHEQFEAAQERIEYNKVNSRRRCKTDYLLRGMMVCELCGRRLVGTNSHRKYGAAATYYRCTTKSQTMPGRNCAAPLLKGHKAEEKVWAWVITRLSDPRKLRALLENTDDEDRTQRERDEGDMRQLLGLRNDLDRDENKDMELYRNDAITLEKFKEQSRLRQERREGIERTIQEIEARKVAREQSRAVIEDATALIEDIQRGLPHLSANTSIEEKRAFLNALHIKLTALRDGRIRINGFLTEDLLTLTSAQRSAYTGTQSSPSVSMHIGKRFS